MTRRNAKPDFGDTARLNSEAYSYWPPNAREPLMQGRNLGLGLERSPAVFKAQFKAFNFEEDVSSLIPAYS